MAVADYEEHLRDTASCIVAFASGDSNVIPDVPNFEFGASLERLGVSYVLMRDSTGNWYHRGIEGIGGVAEVARYIARLRPRYRRVVTTGVSFGSYGALLYGQMAAADEVTVFSPLTVLGRRAPEEFDPVWHHRVRSHLDLDLKPYFPHGPIPFTRAFVSDGDGAELDDTMARRIGIEHVRLIPGHSHAGLARAMREEGWFERLYP